MTDRQTDGQTDRNLIVRPRCIPCSAVKTAVYTNVNGDIVSYTSKTAKIKKVKLLNNTLTFGDVLLGNITFFIFAVFDV